MNFGRMGPFLTATPINGLTVVGFNTLSANSVGTINKPTGTQAGDIVVIMSWANDSTGVWSIPSGFTDLQAGVGTNLGVAMKVAGGSEPSTYTLSNAGTYCGLLCATFRGPTAFDAVGTYTFSSAASSITAPAVTAVAPGSFLIGCFAAGGNVNFSTPSGMTAVGRSTDPAAGMFYQQLTATGSTGTRTTTPSASGYDMGALMFTLKPA